MKLLTSILLVFFIGSSYGQLAKAEVEANINSWYEKYPEGYTLKLNKKAKATITRYHPKRPEEKDDIIEVEYKGMLIQIKFKIPILEITTHKDSLQKHFNYLSLTRIFSKIKDDGWDVYPTTAKSSLRGKGIEFTEGGSKLGFIINWETYTVSGYRDSEKCHEELNQEDDSVSDDCIVSVRKKIGLRIVAKGLKLH